MYTSSSVKSILTLGRPVAVVAADDVYDVDAIDTAVAVDLIVVLVDVVEVVVTLRLVLFNQVLCPGLTGSSFRKQIWDRIGLLNKISAVRFTPYLPAYMPLAISTVCPFSKGPAIPLRGIFFYS